MPNRLLLADGDPKSLRVLDVSLRKAGFDVTTASTGEAAWEAILSRAPDVIVADSDLPGLDGLALCARVRQDAQRRSIPFICLAGDTSVEGKIRGLQAGADEYLTKPAYVNEVIARVGALIQRRVRDKLATDQTSPEAFQGKLSDIAVVDLLDLVAAKGRSGIIHLQGGRGGPATIYFRQGVVIDAEVGRLSGAEAIGRLFGWTEGTFEVEWKNIRRPDAIGRPTADLVLDGMKRLDEWSRLATQHPDLDGVFEVNYAALAERLAEIPDEVNGILRLIDGKRQLGQVVEDSQLSDLDAITVVTRLRDEGIIHEVAASRGGAAASSVARPADATGAAPVPVAAPSSERSSAPTATTSAPDEPSFADTVQAGSIDPRDPEPPPPPPVAPRSTLLRAALPPPPPPPPSKTDRGFPQVELAPPPPEAMTEDDLASLGLLGANGVDSAQVPENLVSGEGVTASPDEAVASSPTGEGATEGENEALGADDIAALLAGGLDEPEPDPAPAWSAAGDASSPADATPRAPASMLQTQRGVGPFPSPSDPVAVAGPPEEPPLLAGHADTPVVDQAVVEPEEAARSLEAPAARVSLDAPSSSAEAAAAAPLVTTAPSADATARYVDPEISHGDALDELGVRGRRRVVRVVVAVAALAGVAAFAVHGLRSSRSVPSGGVSGDKSPVASGPPPPPAATAGESPPPTQVAEASPPQPPPSPALKPVAPAVPDEPPVAPREEKHAAITPPVAAPKAAAGPVTSAGETFRRQLADCRALFGRNRFRDAGAACAAAVEANPRSSEALTMLAHVELNRGHLGRANELAQKAISIYPNQPDAYVIIGGVHQDGGRNAQAKAAYLQYLELAPHGRYAAELRSIVGSL